MNIRAILQCLEKGRVEYLDKAFGFFSMSGQTGRDRAEQLKKDIKAFEKQPESRELEKQVLSTVRKLIEPPRTKLGDYIYKQIIGDAKDINTQEFTTNLTKLFGSEGLLAKCQAERKDIIGAQGRMSGTLELFLLREHNARYIPQGSLVQPLLANQVLKGIQ